jgi:hypothetical protein
VLIISIFNKMPPHSQQNNQEVHLPPSIFTQTRIKYKATPDENIEAFISQVKDYLKLQKVVDPMQQCAFFRMCLHGEAARWGEAHSQTTNFYELVFQFKNYFRSLFRIASIAHVNLPTLKKGKDLTKHILKFRNVINQVYPVPSESDLVTTFIKTLGYLSPYVVQRGDSTLETVIAEARDQYTYKKQKAEFQLMETITKKRKKSKSLLSTKRKKHKHSTKDSDDSSSESSSSSSSEDSDSTEEETEESNEFKSIKKQLKQLQKQIKDQITEKAKQQPHPAANRNFNRHKPPFIRREACQLCGKPGHHAKICYSNVNRQMPPKQNGYPQPYVQPVNQTTAIQPYNRVNAQPVAKPLGVHAITSGEPGSYDYRPPSVNEINQM